MWTCLADSLSAVVADTVTSMLTITPEYAAHIYNLYTNRNAKFTGDRAKMVPYSLLDLTIF